MVAVKLPRRGSPFAVALTMMLVFTLIGLVLGVLIPPRIDRGHRTGQTADTHPRGHENTGIS